MPENEYWKTVGRVMLLNAPDQIVLSKVVEASEQSTTQVRDPYARHSRSKSCILSTTGTLWTNVR